MKHRTYVGLGATAIALLALTMPPAQPLLSPLIALANDVRTYGTDGDDGRDGRSGRDGSPGRSQIVRADGTPQQLSTAGRDGENGEMGEDGDRAYCRAQPRNVRYDLQAADGGDGGDGGRGGNGGNGGNVTIYYTDPAQLQLISVDARGGQPGRGGRGGWGGDGCRCRDRSWRVEVCHDGTCQTERYVCRDGDDGDYGRDGRDGTAGQRGTLWLLNQTEPLLPDAPSRTQALDTFLRQPVALSKNLWEARTGAGALLATGSTVADTYQHYIGRVEAQAQVVWAAPRSQTQFLALSPTATLDDTGTVQFRFPESMWVTGQRDRGDRVTTFTVTGVVRAEDATRLAWGNPSGSGVNFSVAVLDLAAESDYLNTQFEIVYRTADGDPRDSRRLRYITRYEGVVPAELVQRENNRFVLALGRLPISGRYFQSGTYAQVELRIQRSLGSNVATQTLDWQGQL